MELLLYLSKSAGVLSLFYIVYFLFLRNETFFSFNRHFLLIGIFTSFFFPFVTFTQTIFIKAPAYQQLEASQILAIEPVQNGPFLSLEMIFTIFYGVGFILLFMRFLWQLVTLFLLLKKNPPKSINGFKIIEVSEYISPFSFFTYIVYNPKMHPKEEMEMILKHEKAHCQQFHSADVLLSNLLIIVQWFNPLAWGYKKSLEQNLEFLADHKTAKQVPSKKMYQMALVKASSANVMPAPTNYFYKSFIKKRIVMLNKTHSKKQNVLKSIILLPLLAAFLWSFNVSEKIQYLEAENHNPETPSNVVAPQSIKGKNGGNQTNSTKTETGKIPQNISSKEQKQSVSENRPHHFAQDSVKSFQVVITKSTTAEELEAQKQRLKKEYGATLNFSDIHYNSQGEITAISISFSDKNGNKNNYSVNSDEPISDYVLYVSGDGSVSAGTIMTQEQRVKRDKIIVERKQVIADNKAEMAEVKKEMQLRNKEIEKRSDERQKIQEERELIREEAMEDRQKAMETRKELIKEERKYESKEKAEANSRLRKNGYTGADVAQNTENPLFFVDGEESTRESVELIPAENIERVNVLKGKRALKKYGGKGINGIVEIITKK